METAAMDQEQRFIAAASLEVTAPCNTPDGLLYDNIRINSARDLPWLDVVPMHGGQAVLCGGGPSLSATIPEIIRRQQNGCVVYALNGAARFLADNGVRVDCQILLDARADNVKFVQRRNAERYLIASQCHPDIFDALEGEDVTLYHMAMTDIGDYLPKGRMLTTISGTATSGLAAIALSCAMGYQFIHLYGYDSSDAEGEAHAYAQHQTSAEKKRLTISCCGRLFSASFAMYKQAEAFPAFAQMCANLGHTISVHGDGLLPTIAREMTRERDRSVTVYDLVESPSSWDFAIWLIKAEMMRRQAGHGTRLGVYFKFAADGGFGRDQYMGVTSDYRHLVFDKVLRPLLPLVGAVELADEPADGVRYNYMPREIVDAVREGDSVPRFKALPSDRFRISYWLEKHGISRPPLVITLREASHWPQRNSNLEAWLEFARRQSDPVVFVRDTEKADEPIPGFLTCPMASTDVGLRHALYEAALCNFMISNGPATLCIFGEQAWPYLIFGNLVDQTEATYYPGTEEWWRVYYALGVGDQYPWASPLQRMTWNSDTIENIESAWADLRQSKLELALNPATADKGD